MFGMRIGKVALYFICGNAVQDASVNLYSECLTKESHEGVGDFKIKDKYRVAQSRLTHFKWS